MEEKQILTKYGNVNYKIVGEGKPFLILHGWGSKSDRWQKVAALMAEKNLQIIIPDLPGFGASAAPAKAWNLDNYVEWLKDFCEKAPELNKSFYLLGHSFGGSLAVKFTIKYNQKVQELFLVSAACLRKVTFSKKVFYVLSKIAKPFSFLPEYALARSVFYKFVLKKSDYPYMQGIMKETYVKVLSDDLSQRLSFVKVPTIIIWGDKDTLTPIDDARVINQKISHSKLIVVPNGTHSLQIESPELLAQNILDNLSTGFIPGEILSLKHII